MFRCKAREVIKISVSQLLGFKPVAAQQPIKHFFNGGSKLPRCKASEIVKNEAYFPVRRSDERQAQRHRWVLWDRRYAI
jgi:hypothetical protein